MTDNDTLLVDGLEQAQIEKIDLATYRTGDLVERLTELVSIPAAFRKILTTAFFLAAVSTIACYLIHSYSELTVTPLLGMCAYSLVAGVILGLFLGILRIIAKSLQNTESILTTVLEITAKVATDYEQIQVGTIRLPSGGELVGQVYEGVVLPVLEQAVARAFGVLGMPLLWAYRRTIGFAFPYLIERVKANMTTQGERELEQGTISGLATIAKYSETIRTFTASASEIVGNVGRRLRFYAMLPLYILFFASLAMATLPILAVRYFAGG